MKKVEAGVKMFEMDRIPCLALDWSKEGVGLFMLQKYCNSQDGKMGCCNEGWQVVLAGSRILWQNEKNWCPGEGEGLADNLDGHQFTILLRKQPPVRSWWMH